MWILLILAVLLVLPLLGARPSKPPLPYIPPPTRAPIPLDSAQLVRVLKGKR